MARTALSVQTPSTSGLNATYTAATVDGHAFNNEDGNVLLHVKNGGAVSVTVTIDVAKTVDGLVVPDKTVSIPAGEDRFIGPFTESVYNQNEVVTGIAEAILVNTSVQASVTYAALKVVPAH
jgi:hypothetical protein